MKLIVGLGNPGDKYKNTRHNLGFAVLDEYAKKHCGPEITWTIEKKFKAEILSVNYTLNAKPYTLLLVKPQTFMNNSGLAIKSLTTYYPLRPRGEASEASKLPTTNIIVIHDDLDLPLGKIKIRNGGSAAGHHGVESVINSLGDDQFIRVRLGIGSDKKGNHFNAEKFVVEEFLSSEKHVVKKMVEKAVEAVGLLLEESLEAAQNQFN